MNLQELIDLVRSDNPALAEELKTLAPTGETDLTKLKIIEKCTLEKFDGDVEPGQEPVEVITWGDDIPTTVWRKDESCL